jgi:hypothetical protein
MTARTASGRRETGDCRLVVGGLDGEVGVPPLVARVGSRETRTSDEFAVQGAVPALTAR